MVSESRPTRQRRTKLEIDRIKAAILDVLRVYRSVTVRQVFYRLLSNGAIRKSESESKATVVRLLTEMRREGIIHFGWIADNTRWMRKPLTHSSMESALQRTADSDRRSPWNDQGVGVSPRRDHRRSGRAGLIKPRLTAYRPSASAAR